MANSIYNFLPLDVGSQEIRLISIDATTNEVPVSCRLEKADLADSPRYLALSYVWGDPKKHTTIVLNGVQTRVTENLEGALRQLCSFGNDQRFWVDALCINQQDYVERAAQVPLMGQIYSQAEKVVSWLTPDGRGSLEALIALTRESSTEQSEGNVCRHSTDKETGGGPPLPGSLPRDLRAASARLHLGQNDYWQRIWIVQEMILAREIVLLYERNLLPFDALDSVWPRNVPGVGSQRIIPPNSRTIFLMKVPVHLNNMIRHIRLSKSRPYSSGPGIIDLLNQFRGWKATDPRDKIWGLVGFCPEGLETTTVDYSEANGATKVYRSFAKAWIQRHKSLRILQSAGLCFPENPESPRESPLCNLHSMQLPSWAPDWANDNKDYILLDPEGSLHRASGESAAETTFSPCGRVLHATGFRFGSVFDVCSPRSNRQGTTALDHLNHFIEYALCHNHWQAPTISTKEMPRLQILLRTLLVDRTPDDNTRLGADCARTFKLALAFVKSCAKMNLAYVQDDGRKTLLAPLGLAALPYFKNAEQLLGTETLQSYRELAKLMLFGAEGAPWAITPAPDEESDPSSDYWAFFEAAYRLFIGRTLFVTQDGYLGAGLSGIQEGDVVAILFGCNCPVVLRKVGDHHVLVGECFIQGLMDGEAMAIIEHNREKIETFIIH
jgi:Heterokaryon incompatibility protein (HET)